ncbi:PQQ-binding-like beta-propeller repeat protein [Sphingomonas quercus]|uniref:PQQ-binding-like beta-propeller repeat protein n=1 Tax=Sphingomonas quercus TaxID=2842451 RepID=A0ABS6BJ98_9SPHN|nr:PQQ-binding-like beta-propeller repeat protein [Sphingomonas quercus]MBU3077511.1 PQQ-binding-like beta-propeller repeat protein [Sphingomonas quercus]
MKALLGASGAVLALALGLSPGGRTIAQPASTAPAALPDAPGRATVQRMCSGCHGMEWITSRRETREKWTSLVMEMVSRGARGSDEDIGTVVAYLSDQFGKPSAPAAVAAAPNAATGPGAAPIAIAVAVPASAIPAADPRAQWPLMGGDAGAQRHSALDQINRSNVGALRLAWSWSMMRPAGTAPAPAPARPGAAPIRRRLTTQITPVVADGRMYLTTPDGRAVALDPDSGTPIWSYDIPDALGGPGVRSLAYRRADATMPAAIYFGTNQGYLVALDAATGRPLKGFGKAGAISLRTGLDHAGPSERVGLSSPPALYKNLIIAGVHVQEQPAMGPAGDVRAWDARTGALVWTFHTIPRPGEPGSETWEGESWRGRSGANVWGMLSVDEASGTVFLPIGSATFDYSGADRPGANLYANSLVALDAATGKRRWHFQTTHHDVWDYDLNAAPVLLDIRRDGYIIPAVAQLSKQAMLFVLDRRTGQPIYPIEERAVPQDGFPAGEHPWPTQPFPALTPQLARARFDPSEIADITPEHKQMCEAMLARDGGLRIGGTYLPFAERPSIMFPGTLGGINWHGGTFDPATGYLITATMSLGEVFQSTPDPNGGAPTVKRYKFWDDARHWPCSAGPWGELVAVDMNSGLIAWRVPLGSFPELEARGIKGLGTPLLGGGITTGGGLVFVGGTIDDRFRAFDTRTGTELWSANVGAAVHALPMTYLGRSGRQYVAFTVSGGGFLEDHTIPPVLMAFALPGEPGGTNPPPPR